MARPKAIAKIGFLSTEEHNAPYVKALKSLGYKVVVLGGSTRKIPPSLKVCIIKIQCVAHGLSHAALTWERNSPETRTLLHCKGVKDVREQALAYKESVLAEQAAKEAERSKQRDTSAQSLEKLRKRARKHEAPKPTKPTKPTPKKAKPMSGLNSRETFLYNEITKTKKMGLGVHDLMKLWESHFKKTPSKSTIGGYTAKLRKHGFIVNLGGKGQNTGGHMKAAWYVQTEFHGAMSHAEKSLEPGTLQRTAYDEHLARFRKGYGATSPKKKEPIMKVVPIPPLRQEPSSPMESITNECELLVLWLREWNVKSVTILGDGTVELEGKPTKSPDLKVRFHVK